MSDKPEINRLRKVLNGEQGAYRRVETAEERRQLAADLKAAGDEDLLDFLTASKATFGHAEWIEVERFEADQQKQRAEAERERQAKQREVERQRIYPPKRTCYWAKNED